MASRVNLPKSPDPYVDPAGYLRSIGAVRERCAVVLEKARKNQLNHFEVDMGKFADTTKFVVSIIKAGPRCRRDRGVVLMGTARLRTRSFEYSSPWQMAAFQCRRPRPNRGDDGELGKRCGPIREVSQTAGPLPSICSVGCRCGKQLVVQEQGEWTDIQTK